MLKAFTPYRFSGPVLSAFEARPEFQPCTPSQAMSIGFVPHATRLIVRIERKVVPGDALKRRVDELAAEVERETGRMPGKKARAQLKEQAYDELILKAFAKRKDVNVEFLVDQGLLLVGSTSAADLDAITSLLIQVCEGLVIGMLVTVENPVVVLDDWLHSGEANTPFTFGRACVLASGSGKVKYDKHTLDCDNVREHLQQGKVIESLAMGYGEHMSFTVTDGLQFKGVELPGLTFDGDDDNAERFLWREHLGFMLAALIAEFGGVA